jgi:hypothetical protein
MTTREKLHHLIEQLSEPDVDEALQYIPWQQDNGFAPMLSRQPSSPEVLSDCSEAGGDVIFLDELKRGPGLRVS